MKHSTHTPGFIGTLIGGSAIRYYLNEDVARAQCGSDYFPASVPRGAEIERADAPEPRPEWADERYQWRDGFWTLAVGSDMPQAPKPRGRAYLVLPAGGYPDTASDYVIAYGKAAVAAELVDYGYWDNGAVSAYLVPDGIEPSAYARSLAASADPYPDFIVSRGPRGGIRWERA